VEEGSAIVSVLVEEGSAIVSVLAEEGRVEGARSGSGDEVAWFAGVVVDDWESRELRISTICALMSLSVQLRLVSNR
jgi:hypothetical protein